MRPVLSYPGLAIARFVAVAFLCILTALFVLDLGFHPIFLVATSARWLDGFASFIAPVLAPIAHAFFYFSGLLTWVWLVKWTAQMLEQPDRKPVDETFATFLPAAQDNVPYEGY